MTANGKRLGNGGNYEPADGGVVYKYLHYQDKEEASSVTFHVTYRPSKAFNRDLELTVTLPE